MSGYLEGPDSFQANEYDSFNPYAGYKNPFDPFLPEKRAGGLGGLEDLSTVLAPMKQFISHNWTMILILLIGGYVVFRGSKR